MNRKPPDEREWALQEAAMRGAAGAGAAPAGGEDARALASYRAVADALRAPPAPALPPDFAARVAALAAARSAPTDTLLDRLPVERWLLPALLAVMAVAALVVAAAYGAAWWRSAAGTFGSAAPMWGVAIAACAALSLGIDRLAAAAAGPHGARPAG